MLVTLVNVCEEISLIWFGFRALVFDWNKEFKRIFLGLLFLSCLTLGGVKVVCQVTRQLFVTIRGEQRVPPKGDSLSRFSVEQSIFYSVALQWKFLTFHLTKSSVQLLRLKRKVTHSHVTPLVSFSTEFTGEDIKKNMQMSTFMPPPPRKK